MSGFPGIQFFRLVDLVVVVVVPVLNECDARFMEDNTFDTAERDALNGLGLIIQRGVRPVLGGLLLTMWVDYVEPQSWPHESLLTRSLKIRIRLSGVK